MSLPSDKGDVESLGVNVARFDCSAHLAARPPCSCVCMSPPYAASRAPSRERGGRAQVYHVVLCEPRLLLPEAPRRRRGQAPADRLALCGRL